MTEPLDDALADEIEQSVGLLMMMPGGGTRSLGIKKTAQVVAALRVAPVPQCEAEPWDICLMIVSEEFYLDETAMEGSPASLIQSYGYAVRDRIKAARQERATPPPRSDAESDLVSFIPITGPGVDALENRKESDNGPSEEQVNADLRRSLVPSPSEAGREAIARIIDANAFAWDQNHPHTIKLRERALAKADAIRALSPDPPHVDPNGQKS